MYILLKQSFSIFLFLISFSLFSQTDSVFHSNGNLAEITSKRNGITTISKYNSYPYSRKIKGVYLISKNQYKGKKRHGVSETYYGNNKLKSRTYYLNNIPNGKSTKYDANGDLTEEVNYKIITKKGHKSSAFHGKKLRYSKGKLTSENNYKLGKLHGEQKVYRKGILVSLSTYKEGTKHGKFSDYYSDGNIKFIKHYYHKYTHKKVYYPIYNFGTHEEYHPNGELKKQTVYQDGKRLLEKTFSTKNLLKSEIRYYGENLDFKETVSYDEIGKVSYHSTEKKVNGYFKRHGEEKRYLAGQLIESIFYKEGKKNGPFTYYHQNGQIDRRGTFEENKTIGKFEAFYPNGELKSISYKKKQKNWQGSIYNWKNGWEKSYFSSDSLLPHRPKSLQFYKKDNSVFWSRYNDEGKYTYLKYNPKGVSIYAEFYQNGKPNSLHVRINHYSLAVGNLINGKVNYIHKTNYLDKKENRQIHFDTKEKPAFEKINNTTNLFPPLNLNPDEEIIVLKDSELFDATKPNGKVYLKNKKGSVILSFERKNNLLDGIFTINYPNGNLLFNGEFKDGLSHGSHFTFNENGDTLIIEKYRDNELYYSKKIDNEGKLEISKRDSLGKETFKYTEDSKGRVSGYADNINKVYRYYYPSGNLRQVSYPDSTNTDYTKNHHYFDSPSKNIQRIYSYNSRKRKYIGENFTYFENGQIRYLTTYLNDKIKKTLHFNENGKILAKGSYINEKKEGWWIETTDSITKDVFYQAGVLINKDLDKEDNICNCVDTTDRMKPRYYNSLKSILDYEDYQLMTVDYFKDIPEKKFNKIYVKNIGGGSFYYDLNLLFLEKFSFNINTNKKSTFTLNNCHTKGFWSNVRISSYNIERNKEKRSFSIRNANVKLHLDLSNFKSMVSANFIDFTANPSRIIFHQDKGIKTESYYEDLCYKPFSIKGIKYADNAGKFISDKNWTISKIENYAPILPEKDKIDPSRIFYNKDNFGVYFQHTNGEIKLFGNDFTFDRGKLILTEKCITGELSIPLYVSDEKGNLQLLTNNTTLYKTTLKKIESEFKKWGFTDVKVKDHLNTKKVSIKFFIAKK